MSHCFAEFARQQVQPTLYSYNVLRVATKDFHRDNENSSSFASLNVIVCYFRNLTLEKLEVEQP
jgi:hypothetical protein